MKKVAIVEDDPDLFALLKYNLEKEGFGVVGTQIGKEALELCSREKPDLLLLDIMLPESDGLQVCRQIRAHPKLANVPLIFLTARASETDRVVGLELGANDYIVKPFFIRELIARVKNQFRGQPVARRTLRAAGIELERDSRRVLRNGSEVALTATEFRLLEHLMNRPGMVFSRHQLLDAVWGMDKSVSLRTVDVHILRLRQKLEADPSNPALILSVRGFGYSFSRE